MNKQSRPGREPLFTIRTQPLGELTPKFWEIVRPDRLPHASHGVKEEGQIVMGQEDTRQHLAREVKVPEIRPRMAPAYGTRTRLVERSCVISPLRVLNI